MKKQLLPLFACLALAFTACEKEEPLAKISGKETLMAQDWKYHDVVVDQDIKYSMFGMTVAYDTTFSPLIGTPPCELDFTIQFLTDDKYDYSLLDTYCGEDLFKPDNSRWKLNENNTEFTLIGSGMAGWISDGSSVMSLGDSAVYKVIELTEKNFIFEYTMDQAAIMESLGLAELGEDFPIEISGSSKIRISLIGQ